MSTYYLAVQTRPGVLVKTQDSDGINILNHYNFFPEQTIIFTKGEN